MISRNYNISSQEIIIETLDAPEEKTVSENIDFSNLEMDEKASKILKENKYENIDTYLSEMNQADESTKAIETGIFLLSLKKDLSYLEL